VSGINEIRSKIGSIQNTSKITKAMEMVAASKMRKAQERMRASRPYAKNMRTVIGHLAEANPEYQHPYLVERESKRVGVIIISTDRGLCGGLNINLFRHSLEWILAREAENCPVQLALVGQKAAGFFNRLHLDIRASLDSLGDTPHLNQFIGTIKVMLDAYDEERIDELWLFSNEFINTITQRPSLRRLIPVESIRADEMLNHWDYLYEPSAEALFDAVLTRYIESQVYQGVVENVACEMAARMVAMKSASDNASDLIEELKLIYNKARQSAITQEIAEIVGGAAAVSE